MYDFVKRAITEVNIVEYVDDVCKNLPCLETYNCRAEGDSYVCVCPEGYVDLFNQCVMEGDGSGDGMMTGSGGKISQTNEQTGIRIVPV